MKKLLIISILMILILCSTVIASNLDAKVVAGDDIILDSASPDNVYLMGGTVIVNEGVNGDLIAFAGTVSVEAPVYEDITIAAGEAILKEDVGGDVRIVAGKIVLSSDVFGDFVVTGGDVLITNESLIGKDVIITGGNVLVDGVVNGNLFATGGNVVIEGKITGDAKIDSPSITFGEDAEILGNLIAPYGTQLDETKVVGEITRSAKPEEKNSGFMGKFLGGLSFLIYLIVGGLLFLLIANKFYDKSSLTLVQKPFASFFWGLLIFIVAPILIFIFMLTLVGIPLALIFLFCYALLFFLSFLVGALFTGKLVYGKVKRTTSRIKLLLIGALFFTIIMLIPILGPLYIMFIIFAGMGSLVLSPFTKNIAIKKNVKTEKAKKVVDKNNKVSKKKVVKKQAKKIVNKKSTLLKKKDSKKNESEHEPQRLDL